MTKPKAKTTSGIASWRGYTFESSCSTTEEFKLFVNDFRKDITVLLKGYNLLGFNRGHFEVSCFFQNIETGKIVYISSSDVRYSPDAWFDHLLIRTAENAKDYTGGRNNFSTLPNIKTVADNLTQKEA